MSDEIIQRLDELKAGQAAIRTEIGELRAEMKAEVLGLRREVLAAVTESNEVVLGSIRALNYATQETRVNVQGLKRA